MLRSSPALALIALAIIMLAGCQEPIGVPSEVHTATTQTVYVTTQAILKPTGHLDLYQWGPLSSQVDMGYDTGAITRAFYSHPLEPDWPYPRSIGFCVFKIPPFDCPDGLPACTLYYYQDSYSGDADLVVNAWYNQWGWPPATYEYYVMYMAMWNSTDTVATDVTHESSGWYSVPLRSAVCEAIADSGATEDTTVYFTGWVYYGSVDDTYTDVSGFGANPPYIKVVYDDGN